MSQESSSVSKMNALLIIMVACLITALGVCAEADLAELGSMDVEALANFSACLLDDASCTEKTSKLKGLFSSLYVHTLH
jgi:hypothetical protein